MAPKNHDAGTADREIVITRVVDAPRELVWQAWTEPGHLGRWRGPRAFTNPTCELDLRPGGAYRLVMRSPDGVDYPLKGFYREIVAPGRLVLTMDCSEHPDAWHRLVNPHHRNGGNPAGEMLTTVTFDECDGKTKLTVRTRFAPAAIRDAMTKLGMHDGWSQSLDRLAEELCTVTAGNS